MTQFDNGTTAFYGQAAAVTVPILGPDIRVATYLAKRTQDFIKSHTEPADPTLPDTAPPPSISLASAPLYHGALPGLTYRFGTDEKRDFQAAIDGYNAQLSTLGTQLTIAQAKATASGSAYNSAKTALATATTTVASAQGEYDAALAEQIKATINLGWQQRNGDETTQADAQTRLDAANEAMGQKNIVLGTAKTAQATAQASATIQHATWRTDAAAADLIDQSSIPQVNFYIGVAQANKVIAYADTPAGSPRPTGRAAKTFASVGGGGGNASYSHSITEIRDSEDSVVSTTTYDHWTAGDFQWWVKLSGVAYRAAVSSGILGFRVVWYDLSGTTVGLVTTYAAEERTEIIALDQFATLTDENGDYWAGGEVHAQVVTAFETEKKVQRNFSPGYRVPRTTIEIEHTGAAISRPGFHPLVLEDDEGSEAERYGKLTLTANPDAPDGNDFAGDVGISLVDPPPDNAGEAQWQTHYHFTGPGSPPGSHYELFGVAPIIDPSWRQTQGGGGAAPVSEQDTVVSSLTTTGADMEKPQGLHVELSDPIAASDLDARLAFYLARDLDVNGSLGNAPFYTGLGPGAGSVAPTDGNFRAGQKIRFKVSYEHPDEHATNDDLDGANFRLRRLTTNLAKGATVETFVTVAPTALDPYTGRYYGTDQEWTEISPTVGTMVQYVGAESAGFDPSRSLSPWQADKTPDATPVLPGD